MNPSCGTLMRGEVEGGVTRVPHQREHPSGAVQHGDPATRESARWVVAYARSVMIGDGFVVYAAAVIALMIRFGVVTEGFGDAATMYVAITVLLTIGWVLALHLAGTYDKRLLGDGADEYAKVFNVSLFLFGMVAIVSYLLQFQTSRGYLGIALPIGLVGLMLNR